MLPRRELRVLVVADGPDAGVLAAGLERVGLPFELVRTQLEALRHDPFDLVLIAEAMLLPEPSRFLQALRLQAQVPLLVAGWGGPDVLTEILLDGADAYLTRPIPDDVLAARIRSLCSRPPADWDSSPRSPFELLFPPP